MRGLIRNRRNATARALSARLHLLLDRNPCPEDAAKAARLMRRLHQKAVRDIRALSRSTHDEQGTHA